MSTPSHASWQRVLAATSRRSLIRALVFGAPAVSLSSLLAIETDARKKRKKSRRKKKRKSQQPNPQVRSDATCRGSKTNATILTPQGLLAQSFTAGQTGLLVRAELELLHLEVASATGNLFLRLAPLVDAFPGPDALASAQVAASSVATGDNVISFAFTNPARVTAGTSYALVLSRDGNGGIAWNNRSGAACDGRSFVTVNGSDPLEADNDRDLLFTTFVQS